MKRAPRARPPREWAATRRRRPGRRPRPALDALDIKILRALQNDGRASFRRVARRVGASVTTVSTRVHQLSGLGVLQGFVPLVSVQRLAEVGRAPHCAVLYVEPVGDSPEAISAVAAGVALRPGVCYIFELRGSSELIVLASTATSAESTALLRALRELPGVARARALPIQRVHKERPGHPIGPPLPVAVPAA
ncbi:MAG: Lrp/AsnC family transcriptional regulator [Thermoplasmata archaeon]|nr:Lrp/AsnC family transcriptional regulator [Thermoplasmata archaeon]